MSNKSIAPKEVIHDDRRSSMGWGRLVMGVFWVFGVVTTIVTFVSLLQASSVPIGSRLVGFLASAIYVLVAIGITHNGRRMRMMAWTGLIIELVGPIITGLLALGASLPPGSTVSPWTDFGANYWYFPIVLAIAGNIWMWYSDPRRIVELAEGIERSGKQK